MPIGLRIYEAARKVAPETVERFRRLPVANVSDVMFRATGTSRLRPMHAGGWLGGPALTVRTRSGDNLLVHKAIAMAAPGDVIVVAAEGETSNAIIGELMSAQAERKGIAGFVIDGAVRDSGALRAGSFPVYAAGVSHRGPYKDGPGEINGTVTVDGMVVEPGDLVIGDEDGLLCVPFDDVETALREASEKHAAEETMMADIQADRAVDRSWIDKSLERLGCEYVRRRAR